MSTWGGLGRWLFQAGAWWRIKGVRPVSTGLVATIGLLVAATALSGAFDGVSTPDRAAPILSGASFGTASGRRIPWWVHSKRDSA